MDARAAVVTCRECREEKPEAAFAPSAIARPSLRGKAVCRDCGAARIRAAADRGRTKGVERAQADGYV